MALTISNISSVLKKVIVPKIQSQLEKDLLFYNKVKKNVGIKIANNYIYIPSRVGRSSGIYAVAEGTEPPAGKAKYAQPYAPMKYVFGTIELTDQAIEATNNADVKAVAAALNTEIDSLKEDFQLEMNRMFQGAGTGKLCQANCSGSLTAITVDGNPNGGDATQYIREGGYVDIGSNTGCLVSSVDSATQFTISSAVTVVNDSVITRTSDDEPMGLAGIIDDGDNVATFQSITRSSSPYYNAHTDDTSEALTEDDMIDIYLKAQEYGKGEKAWLMGRALFKKYGSLLTSMKRTTDLKEVLSGGWKGLEFMGGDAPVLLDYHTWSGYAQLVDFSALTIAQMSDPMKWLEADAHGGILRRSPSVRTNWEGTMKWYCNLIALKVKSMGRLSGKS